MNATITPEQVSAYMRTVHALADAIKESGPRGIGAGVLYAAVMRVMSLDAFERTIGLLTSAGLVRRERSSLLVWVEPIHRRD